MPLAVPKAELIGTSMEMIFYGKCRLEMFDAVVADCATGVYLVVFVQCVRVLRSKHTRGASVSYLWLIALALYGLVTSVILQSTSRYLRSFLFCSTAPYSRHRTLHAGLHRPHGHTKRSGEVL